LLKKKGKGEEYFVYRGLFPLKKQQLGERNYSSNKEGEFLWNSQRPRHIRRGYVCAYMDCSSSRETGHVGEHEVLPALRKAGRENQADPEGRTRGDAGESRT